MTKKETLKKIEELLVNIGKKLSGILEENPKTSNKEIECKNALIETFNKVENCFTEFISYCLKEYIDKDLKKKTRADVALKLNKKRFLIEVKRKQNKKGNSLYFTDKAKCLLLTNSQNFKTNPKEEINSNHRDEQNETPENNFFIVVKKNRENEGYIHFIEDPYAQICEYFLRLSGEENRPILLVCYYEFKNSTLNFSLEEVVKCEEKQMEHEKFINLIKKYSHKNISKNKLENIKVYKITYKTTKITFKKNPI